MNEKLLKLADKAQTAWNWNNLHQDNFIRVLDVLEDTAQRVKFEDTEDAREYLLDTLALIDCLTQAMKQTFEESNSKCIDFERDLTKIKDLEEINLYQKN